MSRFKKLIRSAITMAVALVMIADFPVQALNNKYDANFFSANDIVIYDPEFKCHGGSNALGDTGEADGKVDNAETVEVILRYFTAKGMSLAGAAGFVGNMTQESSLNPRIRQGGKIAPVNFTPVNGEGFGLVQWTYSSRQKPLVALAKSTNRNTTDIDLQLDYVWKELNEGYKSTLVALKNAQEEGTLTPQKAAIIVHGRTRPFMNNPDFAVAPKLGYEASGDKSYALFKTHRIAPAVAAYNKFKGTIADGAGIKVEGGASESVPTEDGGACGGTLDGDAFTVDGMAFPLIVTKEIMEKGSKIGNGTGRWCYKATTNCHHDYNAADIMAPPGTVVVAATDGEVVSARVGANGARCDKRDTITIKSSEGDIWFYTHLKNGSSVVKNGQKVTAGTKLAAVGPSGAADCTAPHLHIDKLPKPAKFRVSCASARCAGYPFVDIQPQLKKLYDQMVAAQNGGGL